MLVRIGLGAFIADVLFYAALHKLRRPSSFFEAIQHYRLFRQVSLEKLRVLGWAVIASELSIATLLIVAPEGASAAAGACLLMAAFLFLVATEDRAVFTNCGCAGAREIAAPKTGLVARNVALFGAAVSLLALNYLGDRSANPSFATGLAALLLSLPFAALAMELPLVLHIVEVDRRKMPVKLQQLDEEMQQKYGFTLDEIYGGGYRAQRRAMKMAP